MKFFLALLFFSLCATHPIFSQSYKIIESNDKFIKISFDFSEAYNVRDTLLSGKNFTKISSERISIRKDGEPWLPTFSVAVGIPHSANPTVDIVSNTSELISNIFVLPFPKGTSQDEELDYSFFDQSIYSTDRYFPEKNATISNDFEFRYSRIVNLTISPYRFNPVKKVLEFNNTIVVQLNFNTENIFGEFLSVDDELTNDIISSSVINPDVAKSFVAQKMDVTQKSVSNYWYNPTKNYFKIYTSTKGVYRVYYQDFVTAGLQLSQNIHINKLELINLGIPVPIEVVDDGDNIFNNNDYIHFIGYPPKPTDFVKTNIYNKTNVYWFSYQSDSTGLRYTTINGFPSNYTNLVQKTLRTETFEEDRIYERLGYAINGNRDYWFWGKASWRLIGLRTEFNTSFLRLPNHDVGSPIVKLRVMMHGLTTPPCSPGHVANISINNNFIGRAVWDGQFEFLFESNFFARADSIPLFFNGNNFRVSLDGTSCDRFADEIRINWFEFEYWAWNYASENNFSFISPPNVNGKNAYMIYSWRRNNVKIFNPKENKIISNSLFYNDPDGTIVFMDSTMGRTEYFLAANDHFLAPDSIKVDPSSNLRATSNSADYIIITHADFVPIAERLKTIRTQNFTDKTIINPRIVVVKAEDIYDEFSNGLLSPFAIRDFLQYAFNNWQRPSFIYTVLIGDMSHDYRGLLPSSQPNFLPSMPYHSYTYGQAVADNMFGTIVGSDLIPDIALSRIAIETIAEGNTFLDKLQGYPADRSKQWRNTTLLMSSGQDAEDEARFEFNAASISLNDNFLRHNGFNSRIIMKFPNRIEYQQFQGSTLEIKDAFNKGAVLANYYGHGGGFQWDLTFLTEDIPTLRNTGRLPFILSVTCYTAHFDNQKSFGEQFILLPERGAIGFMGSTALTQWAEGKAINDTLFNTIYNKKEYVTGRAILRAYVNSLSASMQIPVIAYLGEPLVRLTLPDNPDFEIRNTDIVTSPENPVINDTTFVTVRINNLGLKNSNRVTVELFYSSTDSAGLIGKRSINVFTLRDSVVFKWIPTTSGLTTLSARVNLVDSIPEMDYSDNMASMTVPVFNLSDPSVLFPTDGLVTSANQIEFKFVDNGYYTNRQFEYYIEIDTSVSFTNPILRSPSIIPSNGLVEWVSSNLPRGQYFWRTRLFDRINYGKWSSLKIFTIDTMDVEGFNLSGKQLQFLSLNNLEYKPELEALVLNTQIVPPQPDITKIIEVIPFIDMNPIAAIGLSCLATDGTYLYIADMWYYTLQYDPSGRSRIYKYGTGFNGTVKGQFYGVVPFFREQIKQQIFYHSDGFLYVPYGDAHRLIRLNPDTGWRDTVFIAAGMINWMNSKVENGTFYVSSDSQYVYNVGIIDSVGNYRYRIRVFDPANNWALIEDIIIPNMQSYPGFTHFFVTRGIFYPYENFESGLMRRVFLDSRTLDREWVTYFSSNVHEYRRFYAWAYDWTNNVVFATDWNPSVSTIPKQITKFAGWHLKSEGSVTTGEIGPASIFNRINFNIDTNTTGGHYSLDIYGFNKIKRSWDTVFVNAKNNFDLSFINTQIYNNLRMRLNINDTSYNLTQPMKLRGFQVEYTGLPELHLSNVEIIGDSSLQGFDVDMKVTVKNIGKLVANFNRLNVYLNSSDSTFFNQEFNLPKDSAVTFNLTIPTSNLVSNSNQRMRSILNYDRWPEYYTFNNLFDAKFFVARDSIKPKFEITFDGKEILNEDVVPKNPKIKITLDDNGPLPIDTSMFSILHNNVPLRFNNSDVKFSYTQYPISEAIIEWAPTFSEGRHFIDVMATDGSGNFFDTTFYRTTFNVYEKDDLTRIYNYPNPFKSETHFTFELRGATKPESVSIKIYTVAGRMIRELLIPTSDYSIGFNKFKWDGRDQDGDPIANGIYFYKLFAKYPDRTIVTTEKLAKTE